jgi:hypothetical protein
MVLLARSHFRERPGDFLGWKRPKGRAPEGSLALCEGLEFNKKELFRSSA